MNKLKILFSVLSLFLFATTSTAADDEFVVFAKSLPATKYDKSLPDVPVEKWLNSILPKDIVTKWGETVTDCGEQTGNPEIDRKRDMPLCAEVELKKKGELAGYFLLFVATEKKGILKDDAALYYGFIKEDGKEIQIRKLSEIRRLKDDSQSSK